MAERNTKGNNGQTDGGSKADFAFANDTARWLPVSASDYETGLIDQTRVAVPAPFESEQDHIDTHIGLGLRAQTRVGLMLDTLWGGLTPDKDAKPMLLVLVFALGIVGYFLLPQEPVLSVLIGTGCVGFLAHQYVVVRGYRHSASVWLLISSLILAGAATAQWRVHAVASPMLGGPINGTIKGVVLARDLTAGGGYRYDILVSEFSRLAREETPKRVRLSQRGGSNVGLEPGQGVRASVRLVPHGGPAHPGGYDFAFPHFFDGRGALGFTFGSPKRWTGEDFEAFSDQIGTLQRARIVQAQLRTDIAARLRQTLPDGAGQVAVALITGERTGIPQDVQESLRQSGLAHILAISGLHMGLIAGTGFLIARIGFATVGAVALNHNAKKYAAAVALFAATLYFAISGGSVATQRAFITLAVMLTALLLDRRALSLRNVAVAGAIVLFLQPEVIFSAGFQMSFSAVASLVVCYRAIERFREETERLLTLHYPLKRGQKWRVRMFARRRDTKSSAGWFGADLL